MTRPVIALVIDPTSIGVVSSAPIPASRTGWAASRSISATATAWLLASQPLLRLLVDVGQDRGVAVAGTARSGDNTQDTTATVTAPMSTVRTRRREAR